MSINFSSGVSRNPRSGNLWQIFLFEIKYRLRRVDTYLYFLVFFIFTFLCFANGGGAPDKVFVNAAAPLSKFYCATSIFMMVVTAAIMGTPLYRDIEYNTREYYLSYPISKNNYFWGRYLGSFLFVILIGSSLIWGSLAGAILGPKIGWIDADRVGPFHFINYLHPYICLVLPNLFLTSSIFFGLVAYTRNVKSIYTGVVILYLGYMISLFIFRYIGNKIFTYLLDPFAFVPVQMQINYFSPSELNHSLVSLNGALLLNRIVWTTIGLLLVLVTWNRFSFARFFGAIKDKKVNVPELEKNRGLMGKIPAVHSGFKRYYNFKVILRLTRIEWISIIGDNYFRLILGVGTIFLGFIFWMGFGQHYGVKEFPRTVMLMDVYNHNFLLFVFIILLFYTGETVHREKTTRFAIINDALPPANWVMYFSKLLALVGLAILLASVPLLAGLGIQVARGFPQFNLPVYLITCYGLSLPLFIEMILFAFAVHVLVNNKFAGHAIGMILWVFLIVGNNAYHFDYNLLLYSFSPGYEFSDMDGIGPSLQPQFWFHLYWLCCGGLLLILAALFYYRGVMSSFRERRELALRRFGLKPRIFFAILLGGFLATGSWIYYNVSYINKYLTYTEKQQRAVAYEKQLKKYANDPLPSVMKLQIFADIFPEERKAISRAFATISNKTNKPITRLLLDGDGLSEFSVKYNGIEIPYSNPLIFSKPKFSFFLPQHDTSMYRLYQFPIPLAPGDTGLLEINSLTQNPGFTNAVSGPNLLHNGTAYKGGLPDLGYDEDEELGGEGIRKEYHLPKKEEEFPPQGDSAGSRQLIFTSLAGLSSFETTVSVSGTQVVIAPGNLIKSWKQNGRNYFHYLLDSPKTYFPFPFLAARYSILRDSVRLSNGRSAGIEFYFHPTHTSNLKRFMPAYKDGLIYFSTAYGPFQFRQMRLIESSIFAGDMASFPGLTLFGERYGWNADFEGPDQFDFCYFSTAFQLGCQWWQYQVAPNHTLGSNNIAVGLAKYGAYVLFEKKFGKDNMKILLKNEADWYLFRHRFSFKKENELINSNLDYVWDTKAGFILYGLKDLIGEDSLNAALKEFREAYGFRDKAPYAGSNDLYLCLKKHVPDSYQYYLRDSWEKITIYDNKVVEAKISPMGKNDGYLVNLKVSVAKTYTDSAGKESAVRQFNDFIEIGIFGPDTKNPEGRTQTHTLYLEKKKLTAGEHSFNIIVKGNPDHVGIDPFGKLIDRMPEDNVKVF